jgi:hypothetical protein
MMLAEYTTHNAVNGSMQIATAAETPHTNHQQVLLVLLLLFNTVSTALHLLLEPGDVQ